MAGKRKAKRVTTQTEDFAKPSKWRLQHGGFSEPVRDADPETGSPVVHRRAVDTLGMMLANVMVPEVMPPCWPRSAHPVVVPRSRARTA
jgi:hypothetical protein